jgi:hypothetical protein
LIDDACAAVRSEHTSTVEPPPAAGFGVAAGELELVAGLALETGGAVDAVDAVDALAADALGDDVGEAGSACVSVAGSTVAAGDAVDFVAGLHADNDNATAPTTMMAAAVDSARTCMAAPCSDDCATGSPPHRS